MEPSHNSELSSKLQLADQHSCEINDTGTSLETALDAARCLKEHTLPDKRNQILNDLLDTWGLNEGLQALAKTYGEYYGELAKYLHIPSGKPVLPGETILTYYQALTGGGIENVQMCLIEIWQQLGYHVAIVLEEEPDEDVAKTLDVPIYLLPAASAANYSQRVVAFERILEETDARAIVYHKWLCRVLLWDLILLKRHDITFICHTHGVFSHSIHNGDLFFPHLAPTYSLCDALVTLSSTDRYFWSHFNDHVYETINPTALDLSEMEPSANPKKHNILWLARISPEKGAENALLIFKMVLERIPDATLYLVGTAANDEYQQKIEKQISLLGIEDHVILPGWTTDQETYYRNADVFLATSTDEGFALTLAESRYYGVPCVMFDLPSLTLQGKQLGIDSVPQGDNAAASNAIVDLLLNEDKNDEYRTLAQNGYKSLYEHFNFSRFWLDIFRSIGIAQPDKTIGNEIDFFHSIYQEATFHYECGIKSRNEQITISAERAKLAEAKAKKLSDQELALSHEIQQLENAGLSKDRQINDLKNKLKAEKDARIRMRNSVSWKIGRAITRIPRKIRQHLSF